ncbi:Hypothetical_protein [Hexamita inflata]|uniref:Hypothetical_protein n=1 Tax=Hexamita inflata TaxID=28002 RepID=A0AA86PYH9_9EUKA|nr:Hypothetical protein HINF_LOCUS34841 [Hexamita inflata]
MGHRQRRMSMFPVSMQLNLPKPQREACLKISDTMNFTWSGMSFTKASEKAMSKMRLFSASISSTFREFRSFKMQQPSTRSRKYLTTTGFMSSFTQSPVALAAILDLSRRKMKGSLWVATKTNSDSISETKFCISSGTLSFSASIITFAYPSSCEGRATLFRMFEITGFWYSTSSITPQFSLQVSKSPAVQKVIRLEWSVA